MKGSLRPLAWLLAIALVVLPVVGLLRGWFAADRWPVTRLVLQAEFNHVDGAQIRDAVRPRLGRGFFALDLDGVQQAVARLPWVATVEARKRWPDTLVLTVYERQPFAYWNGNRLISRRGVVFDPPGGAAGLKLPQLRGPDSHLAEVVGFYASVQKALVGTAIAVTGVSLSDRGSWSLTTATGAQIVLGDRDQAGARLRRFLDVYPQIAVGHGEAFAYADLRYTNGFAVRWPPAPDGQAGGSPRT